MSKFFVDKNQIKNEDCSNVDDIKNETKNGYIEIIGTDVNHIKNVLRYSIGKQVEICCKDDSKNYTCEIFQIDSKKILCKIIEVEDSSSKDGKICTDSNVLLDVYQGLPKFDKMEFIIQKGTELGVHSFIPVKMKRSIVKLDEKDALKKVERWNKISEVAAKQSLRNIIPCVEIPIKISELVNRISTYDLVILAYEEEKIKYIGQELFDFKKESERFNQKQIVKVAVIIGPEGGLDNEEVQMMKEYGAKVVSLGKRILRTETASMQLASIIMYELENRS